MSRLLHGCTGCAATKSDSRFIGTTRTQFTIASIKKDIKKERRKIERRINLKKNCQLGFVGKKKTKDVQQTIIDYLVVPELPLGHTQLAIESDPADTVVVVTVFVGHDAHEEPSL